MAEYPKVMRKSPSSMKLAHNAREEVKYKWDGYRVVSPEAPAAEETVEVPQLPLAELVEKAEELGIDVPAEVQSWETNGGATEAPKPRPTRKS